MMVDAAGDLQFDGVTYTVDWRSMARLADRPRGSKTIADAVHAERPSQKPANEATHDP